MENKEDVKQDDWTSEEYQNAGPYVPKLATKVLGWLDVQSDDLILDVGCGDGVLDLQIAQTLGQGSGKLHGVDSSPEMISAATKAASSDKIASKVCTFGVLDATQLLKQTSHFNKYDKVFSNAAIHWIITPPGLQEAFFQGVKEVLKPNGVFCFEMGGMGNVAEMRATLLLAVARRVGIEKAREADPFFFPDETWMKEMLEVRVGGWKVEKLEKEYRPTWVAEGGIERWVRLFGKRWLDAVKDVEEREKCIKEVCDGLETVCKSPSGGDWIGYVRLRGLIRKI